MNHAFCELYCHQNQQRIQSTICASIDVLVEVNENSLSGLDFEGQTCIMYNFEVCFSEEIFMLLVDKCVNYSLL